MVNFYNNLSPTTKLLIQSFGAVLGSVLAACAVAVYQSYSASGVLNPQMLLVVAMAAFIPLFGKAMHDWIPPHAVQIIQAGKDNETALYDALQRQQQISSSAIASKPPVQQQPVVIHAQSSLSTNDIAAISQQLAVSLANMAASPAPAPDMPVSQTDVSDLATQSVPAVSIASVDVPQVPFPDYAKMSWGDTGIVPAVTPSQLI